MAVKHRTDVLDPPGVAQLLAVNSDKVRGWITSGQLKATNVGDRSRPRWRIFKADLEAFLATRASPNPTEERAPHKRGRRRQLTPVKNYFTDEADP